MIDKKIYTGPIYNRVAFGIFDDKFEMDRITLNASIKSKDKQVKIDNINPYSYYIKVCIVPLLWFKKCILVFCFFTQKVDNLLF